MTLNPIVFLLDKLRILAMVKKAWGDRVTTVFPSQGKFAVLASDLTVGRIGNLLGYDLPALLAGHQSIPFATEVT